MKKFMQTIIGLLHKQPSVALVPWKQSVVDAKPRFEALAKENQIALKFQEESMFAMRAINKNDALKNCDITSIKHAIIDIAMVGLTLNPVYEYCYLVPYDGQAVLTVSYRGLSKLATDTGAVLSNTADVIHENDTFRWNGLYEIPDHTFDVHKPRGNVIGAYCVAEIHSGRFMSEFLSAEQLKKCYDAAKTKKIWNSWYEEQCKKSSTKRASKRWPKSVGTEKLDKVINFMNQYEGSDFEQPDKDEPVVLISQEQIKDLQQILINIGVYNEEYIVRQLANLARSMNCEGIDKLPAQKFDLAKNKLLKGLTGMAGKQ